VRERFRVETRRVEGQLEAGRHEWIPVMLLEELTELGAEEVTRAEQWLALALRLTAPTTDLIYTPSYSEVLTELLRGFVAESAGDEAALAEKLKAASVHADEALLSGHVGALYVEISQEDGSLKRVAKTKGSHGFHEGLVGLWRRHKMGEVSGYGGVLAGYVEGEELLWEGDVKVIVDDDLEEHAMKLRSEYKSSGGNSWGDTLGALAAQADKKHEKTIRSLENN